MSRVALRRAVLAASLATLALSGCANYVKRDEFDSTIAELRAVDARLQEQLTALSQKHDALVTQLAGRVRVDAMAHFETDSAVLSEEDKPLLDDFARAVRSSASEVLVTVEGFADPSGSAAYNKRLGQRRAEAVREYLIGTGGLQEHQVRTVSYGEDRNRQVREGATGEAGRPNRRVSLVVDYAGPAQAGTASL
ncbi:MAG TPA: OmpA family protein [Lysobacter sp.]|nr:OmpA family protein [Lysobacter sp.]